MKKFITIAGICCALPLIIVAIIGLSSQKSPSTKQSENMPAPATTPETTSQNNQSIEIQVGNMAPDFSFQTIEGKTISLSSLRGQSVLFAFVVTQGCPACVIEAIAVREAQRQIPFKVVQLVISTYDTVESLQYFKNEYGAPDWLVGFDKDNKIRNQYQVKSVDTTYIVDAKRKIIYQDDGDPADTETIVNVLKKL